MSVNIVGISAFFHDAACCLLQDGVLVAAAEEERFSRLKADPSVPKNAFNYCLQEANLSLADIDIIAYYEDPKKKLARQLWSGILPDPTQLNEELKPHLVESQFRNVLGYEGDIRYYDHHLSHAASSFFFSGFNESAILTVDGVGEWNTTTYGTGIGQQINLFESVDFPDSLGLLYSTITSYLGFGVNDGEYKVMGLAPYGSPVHIDKIRRLIIEEGDGQYKLDMEYFDFLKGKRMFSDNFLALFGKKPREEGEPVKKFHEDIARSMQAVLEEILLAKAGYLHKKTGLENLCMAGGVALNCVANGQILKKGPFKQLFVQPASNDAGGCIGAAALAHVNVCHARPENKRLSHVYLGPSYSNKSIDRLFKATALKYHDFHSNTDQLIAETAQRLADGKVIGWFHGRMEFGPRALGGRSILADPRSPVMRDLINAMVKKREGFRPFAPAVMEDKAAEHFDMDHPSPFMLETCQVISTLDLPAITHVDGSARVQTVNRETNRRFYDLLAEFNRITDCPILLNTSFNVKGEPIVCSPEDAIKCFATTDIDCLVLENVIIDKKDNNVGFLQVVLPVIAVYDNSLENAITHDVYTFI